MYDVIRVLLQFKYLQTRAVGELSHSHVSILQKAIARNSRERTYTLCV